MLMVRTARTHTLGLAHTCDTPLGSSPTYPHIPLSALVAHDTPSTVDGHRQHARDTRCNAIESLNARYRLEGRHPIRSAARSPIMIAVACVLPRTMSGMIDVSAMWRPCIPWTRSSGSTTDASSVPERQVPTGWF